MADLARKSVYDVLKDNLRLARRRTFLHRYMYLGEHRNEEAVEKLLTDIVNEVNNNYIEEKITGLLLLYPNYFIHIIDSCETAFMKHLQMIYVNPEEFIGNGKCVAAYHNINQRFFDEWGVRHAKPPILLEKIQAADIDEIKRNLQICVFKTYNLCIELREIEEPDEEQSPQLPRTIKIGEIVPSTMNQYLPEYNLVQYIMEEPFFFDVRLGLALELIIYDNKVGILFSDDIWPVRADYVPYTVFEQEINPIKNLPNAKEKS